MMNISLIPLFVLLVGCVASLCVACVYAAQGLWVLATITFLFSVLMGAGFVIFRRGVKLGMARRQSGG